MKRKIKNILKIMWQHFMCCLDEKLDDILDQNIGDIFFYTKIFKLKINK
jgi:hypothetical protein